MERERERIQERIVNVSVSWLPISKQGGIKFSEKNAVRASPGVLIKGSGVV